MGKRKTRSSNNILPAKSSPSSIVDKIKVMDNKILAVMFEFHMDEKFDVTLTDIASQVGCQERTKSFRERWSVLKNQKKYIGPSKDGDKGTFQLTKAGVDHAATPEYKEMLKELSLTPKTNKEHQERIKKYLKKAKSIAMFDFLLEYAFLSSDELCALVGQNKRSHSYHYSWQELRNKGLVEQVPDYKGEGKKFRLADKAFLKAKEHRSGINDVDTKKLAEAVASGVALIESRKKGGTKQSKNNKKVKNEEVVKEEADQDFKDAAIKEEVDIENKDEKGVAKEEAMSQAIKDFKDDATEGEEVDTENKDEKGVAKQEPNQDFEDGGIEEEVDTENKDEKGVVEEEANQDFEDDKRNREVITIDSEDEKETDWEDERESDASSGSDYEE
uniref:Uncharacterized protein n=1 Tax=Pseudo-nitzschia australis TaxID=44445 RepID=A0A7S4AIX7_9STRA